MQLMTYPFRLRGGAVTTTDQDGDGYLADAVARIALTRVGELRYVPTYGVQEQAFDTVAVASINAVLALHGPPCAVTLDSVTRDERTERATLRIERSAN